MSRLIEIKFVILLVFFLFYLSIFFVFCTLRFSIYLFDARFSQVVVSRKKQILHDVIEYWALFVTKIAVWYVPADTAHYLHLWVTNNDISHQSESGDWRIVCGSSKALQRKHFCAINFLNWIEHHLTSISKHTDTETKRKRDKWN